MPKQILLTPGPLTTSDTVKQAANRDLGSRDQEFIDCCQEIRKEVCVLTGSLIFNDQNMVGENEKYDCILQPGSGTYGVESVLTTILHKEKDTVLLCVNGAYGYRMEKICKKAGINYHLLEFSSDKPITVEAVLTTIVENSSITAAGEVAAGNPITAAGEVAAGNPITAAGEVAAGNPITAVAIVHLETTSGILNPIQEIGQMLEKDYPNIKFIVDAMSSCFGLPIDVNACNIDYLIFSSNKCAQSIPGFSVIVANIPDLLKYENNCPSLSLDLYDQYTTMQKTKQFRFTPPVQSLLAFRQALRELKEEGGIQSRYLRYSNNQKVLSDGMRKMGFRTYLDQTPLIQGPIITTFFCEPLIENFENFYNFLKEHGFVIYPGKMTTEETFRIGTIGCVEEADMVRFLEQVQKYLEVQDI